eukprot:7288241-Alexandrium_andersonii.AAC.1
MRARGEGDSSSPRSRPAVPEGRARVGLRDPPGSRVRRSRDGRALGQVQPDDCQPNPQRCV